MKAGWMVLAAGLGLSAPAFGQTGAEPAEYPAASYAGREYVDSRGCAFARGTVDGSTVWLSRIDENGQPVCGLPPSTPAPLVDVAKEDAGKAVAALSETGNAAQKSRRQGRKPGTPRATGAGIAADRLVIAVGEMPASAAGCTGADRAVAVVTLRTGARHAVCDGLAGDPQAVVLAKGPGALGPALPPLAAPAAMVHVGAYRVPANAMRAAERLRALGLPVARASGGSLTLLLTGPVGADQVRGIVARLRANGFPDAYPDVVAGRPQPSQMP